MVILIFCMIFLLHSFVSFTIGLNTIRTSDRKRKAVAFAILSSVYYVVVMYFSMEYFFKECGFENSTATEMSGLGIFLGALTSIFIIAPISSLFAATITLPIYSIVQNIINHKYKPVELIDEKIDQ